MVSTLNRAWRYALGLLIAFSLHTGAQAGLVTGNWDPQFGSFLPGLSWQVKADVLVPNACSNQADGVYSTSGGACDNSNPATFKFLGVWVRMFDTGLADPNDFFGINAHSSYFGLCDAALSGDPHCNNIGNFFTASNVRVAAGQVVGFDTTAALLQTFSCFAPCSSDSDFFSAIPSAEGNLFQFDFTTDGPELICLACAQTFAEKLSDFRNPPGPPRDDVTSSTADLNQFLVTYTSDTTDTPKFTDGEGNALGARLDSSGNYLGQSTTPNGSIVPEPGLLMLLLAALGAVAVTRRRPA